MKFEIALVATVCAANALDLAAEPQVYSPDGKSFDIGSHYTQPDYTQAYGEELPGADFNRQVYDFNENKQIWDQNDYEERVKVEAELLVALEALKTSVSYLGYDIHELNQRIATNAGRIGANQGDIYENHAANQGATDSNQQKVEHLFDSCRHTQHDLDTYKDALTLYCQQFAFAHEMNYACASLLSCRDTQLHFKYAFSGTYVQPHEYDTEAAHQDHQKYSSGTDDQYQAINEHHHGDAPPLSSHGFALNVTGGHVPYAELPHGTDAEIAAAAINPHEAVLQVDGKSLVAPLDQIDPSKVELCCDEDGCVLIPDDGNPHNDIHVPQSYVASPEHELSQHADLAGHENRDAYGVHGHNAINLSDHDPRQHYGAFRQDFLPDMHDHLEEGEIFDEAGNYGGHGAFVPEIAASDD